MPYWFTQLVGLLLRDRRFGVHMGSSWRPERNSLPEGSVQLALQRPASYTWPKIHLRWRHMSRHSRPILSELECSLSSYMARMSHFCWQWRLKPSISETISSVFHLHKTSATRELSVYLDAQRLRRECHPTCLGMTLDPTLSGSATQPVLGWH